MEDAPNIGEAQFDFALKLFLEVANEEDGKNKNLVISPASIILALAVAYSGCSSQTKRQIREILFSNAEDDKIEAHLRDLNELLNKPDDDSALCLANHAFVQKVFHVLPAYQENLRQNLNSEICPVDFNKDLPNTINAITSWLAKKTTGKITELFGDLNQREKLLIVNAVCFEGKWSNKFDLHQTVNKPFSANARDSKILPSMHAEGMECFHASNELCQVLGLPYVHNNLLFVLLLPNERFGLLDLESKLDGRTFAELLKNMSKAKIQLQMPKYKLEFSISLPNILRRLGIDRIFSSVADFSKITTSGPLCVSDIVHKSVLKVDEDGKEIAATNQNQASSAAEPQETKIFIVDQPFLFAIVEKINNILLFVGHFYG